MRKIDPRWGLQNGAHVTRCGKVLTTLQAKIVHENACNKCREEKIQTKNNGGSKGMTA